MAQENEAVTLVARDDELCQKANAGESCSEPAIYRCHKCGELYCITHASEVDPKHFCTSCLIVADIGLEAEPLVDEEGVRQQGRLLHPVGHAFTEFNKLLIEMNDEELKTFIQGYIVLVHEAEQLKTFREITLAHAKHEAFDRQIAKLEKVGGQIVFPARKIHVAKPAKAKASATDILIAKLKKAGVTPEILQAILDAKKKG